MVGQGGVECDIIKRRPVGLRACSSPHWVRGGWGPARDRSRRTERAIPDAFKTLPVFNGGRVGGKDVRLLFYRSDYSCISCMYVHVKKAHNEITRCGASLPCQPDPADATYMVGGCGAGCGVAGGDPISLGHVAHRVGQGLFTLVTARPADPL